VERVVSRERFVIQPLDNVIYSLDAGGDHKQDCNPLEQSFSEAFILRYRKKYRKLLAKRGGSIKASLSAHESAYKNFFNLYAQKSVQAHASLAMGFRDFYPPPTPIPLIRSQFAA
jgi:hypothetical protein